MQNLQAQQNENGRQDMDDLKIKFDGQTHQIEANTLINSLLHLNTIIQEINKELKTDKTISIKINALPEGSFPSGRRLPFVLKHGKHPLPKTNIGYIRNAI